MHKQRDIVNSNGIVGTRKVTEYGREAASKGPFPAKNAIIAALSQGILVTECAKDSGSLITAAYAKEFGRPVFAVPGLITSHLAKGTNSLIQQGAIAVDGVSDIIRALKGIAPGFVNDAGRC